MLKALDKHPGMAYHTHSCGLVTRSQLTTAKHPTPLGSGLRQSYGNPGDAGPVCGNQAQSSFPNGVFALWPRTSDCSSGVLITIGGSLKRRDDVSPYRQRVEGQSAGLTQAHEVVWPILAGCHLPELQRRPIAIPMPQRDLKLTLLGLGLFCPEPLLPDSL